jgi:hypothetical protein
MIIVQLTGGLGNQLFQFAMGRALAEKSRDKLLLDIRSYQWDTLRKYELHSFSIQATIAQLDDIALIQSSKPFLLDRIQRKLLRKEIPYFRNAWIKEPAFSFDTNFTEYRSTDIYLEGYWQSEKYFSSIRPQLLKELWVSQATFSMYFNEYKKYIIDAENAIAIHVRRGDYVSNFETTAFHGLCDLNYYLKAMQLMEQSISNPTYFIFSDDKEYVREIFGSKENVCIIQNLAYDYEEMFLMSLCKHNIIANSTFSWWGAYLNENTNKQVIAPKLWFGPKGPKDTEDIIPSTWVKR